MLSHQVIRRPAHDFRIQPSIQRINLPPLKHIFSSRQADPVAVNLPRRVQSAVEPFRRRFYVRYPNILRQIPVHLHQKRFFKALRIPVPFCPRQLIRYMHVRDLPHGMDARVRPSGSMNFQIRSENPLQNRFQPPLYGVRRISLPLPAIIPRAIVLYLHF